MGSAVKASLMRRLDRLAIADRRRPNWRARRGELQRLGIDLGKLTNAELDRLEALVSAWPDDDTLVAAAVVYACFGKRVTQWRAGVSHLYRREQERKGTTGGKDHCRREPTFRETLRPVVIIVGS